MSFLDTLKEDALTLFKEVSAKVAIAKQIWVQFSSTQNRALALKLYADAVKAVADGSAAASASGMNLTLDAAVVADIKTIIADAKAGDPLIMADLALLGIKL